MIVLFVFLTAVFALGAVYTYRQQGRTWVSVGLAAATVLLGFGSILEALVVRIDLTDDALLVTDFRGRQRFQRSEIDRIEEARGVPPSLRLVDGRWVKLPSVGNNLGNSVRAWLRESSRASVPGE